ncbi:MAG TPA: phage holin family protein [Candidatus Saccharimonadales bacterium]|nr:phage holin family protein [Candidatus Saccharimonadales bacterium]
MTKHLLTRFLLRWAVSSLGLFIAAGILGDNNFGIGDNFTGQVLIAGLVLSIVNMAIKPFLIILSFPAIVLSLGLFMLIVNGAVILLASWIDNAIYVRNFGVAIVVGIILGLVNFLVTRILEDK